MADYSDDITAGGTAQVAATADVNRNTLFVANDDDTDFWISFGGTAAATSPAILVSSGDKQMWGREYRELITKAISIYGATTGKKYTLVDTKG